LGQGIFKNILSKKKQQMDDIIIIAINPGSTSTKIAVFQNNSPIFLNTIRHSVEELEQFKSIYDQFNFRKQLVQKELDEADINTSLVRAVVGRGGLMKPNESGVYFVNDKMMHDLKNSPFGEHASNLGGLIAYDIAKSLPKAKAYIVDPVVVDELQDIARISGHPLFQRKSVFHALNQKIVARNYAELINKKYEDLSLIVVHLGGGITVGAHKKGKVIDVNQGIDGEGPFSPERSGTLPVGDLIRACFSGKYTEKQMIRMIVGEGGLVAYLGTNDAMEVEKRVLEGDEEAILIYSAMAYQVAKMVGAMCTVLKGKVDSILITGGIAYDKWFVNQIVQRISYIAPIHIYPGEDEMLALAINGLRIVKGEMKAKVYR